MNIAVYCSSSDKIDEKYFNEARLLGEAIAQAGHTLLYGGTFMGLMGAVAKANEANGGERIGIITQGIHDMEEVPVDEHNLLMVPNLSRRKAKMAQLSDMHIVLSGGFGTLDEALSILAMKQVGETDAPIIFLNTDGFYDALQQQFERYYNDSFASAEFKKAYQFVETVAELVKLF